MAEIESFDDTLNMLNSDLIGSGVPPISGFPTEVSIFDLIHAPSDVQARFTHQLPPGVGLDQPFLPSPAPLPPLNPPRQAQPSGPAVASDIPLATLQGFQPVFDTSNLFQRRQSTVGNMLPFVAIAAIALLVLFLAVR